MSLVRWDPFDELQALRQHMSRFIEHGLRPWREGELVGNRLSPRLDVIQTDEEVICQVELPGLVSRDDVDITVSEDSLTIRGEMKRRHEHREENYFHSERYYGTFQRTIPLPARVKPEQSSARYEHGILEIRMPKEEPARRRQVKLNIH